MKIEAKGALNKQQKKAVLNSHLGESLRQCIELTVIERQPVAYRWKEVEAQAAVLYYTGDWLYVLYFNKL